MLLYIYKIIFICYYIYIYILMNEKKYKKEVKLFLNFNFLNFNFLNFNFLIFLFFRYRF